MGQDGDCAAGSLRAWMDRADARLEQADTALGFVHRRDAELTELVNCRGVGTLDVAYGHWLHGVLLSVRPVWPLQLPAATGRAQDPSSSAQCRTWRAPPACARPHRRNGHDVHTVDPCQRIQMLVGKGPFTDHADLHESARPRSFSTISPSAAFEAGT